MSKEFEVTLPAINVNCESRGVTVPVALQDIPPHIIRELVMHGLKQKVGDAASGAFANIWREVKGADAPAPSATQRKDFGERHGEAIETETRALMQKAADALLRGDWHIRQPAGSIVRSTPEETLALQLAQAALADRFAAALVARGVVASPRQATGAMMHGLGGTVAEFFTLTPTGRATWNKDRLRQYIAKAKEDGAADFMALAREELARQAEAQAALAEAVAEVESFDDL